MWCGQGSGGGGGGRRPRAPAPAARLQLDRPLCCIEYDNGSSSWAQCSGVGPSSAVRAGWGCPQKRNGTNRRGRPLHPDLSLCLSTRDGCLRLQAASDRFAARQSAKLRTLACSINALNLEFKVLALRPAGFKAWTFNERRCLLLRWRRASRVLTCIDSRRERAGDPRNCPHHPLCHSSASLLVHSSAPASIL